MDPRDDDIQFDFFEEEPATTEAQSSGSRVRLPRRGGRGPGTGGPSGQARGLTPLLRLLALIALIVAALVFFGLLIQSCASTSKHDFWVTHFSPDVTATEPAWLGLCRLPGPKYQGPQAMSDR